MSRELALRLARDGLVERWQIENALQAQLIYEGTLLSNMLRLGYLDESNVLNYLGKQNQLPLVREERLLEISTRIIDMAPRDLVAGYRFLPLGMQSEMLVVAVNAPLAADVVAFVSDFLGVKLKQVLTFEHLLLAGIRRHFAMCLPSLIKHDKPMIDFGDPRKQSDEAQDGARSSGLSSTPSISLLNSAFPGMAVDAPPGSTNVPVEEESPDASLKTLEGALVQADSRDEIIQVACSWLAGYGVAAAFLTAKKNRLEGFFAQGDEEKQAAVKGYSWAFEDGDEVSVIVQNGVSLALPDTTQKPWLVALAKALELAEGTAACLVPLSLKGKTVGLLLGIGERCSLVSQASLSHAQSQLATSLETLILSRKIGV